MQTNDDARRSPLGIMRRKFRMHKCTAMKRGIEFLFEFEEWRQWWEDKLGSNWVGLRGKTTGKYVMGRKNDIGPYHPDNVICITTSENITMANSGAVHTAAHRMKNSLANRGIGNARAKLNNAQVLEIYSAKVTISELARTYGVSRPVIKGIKTGKNWSHITGA